MNTRQLKKFLVESLQEQDDYIEFCIDCLKKLYPNDHESIIPLFESFLESREEWGTVTLQDLEERFQEENDKISKIRKKMNEEAK